MNEVVTRFSFREDHFTLETKDKKADLSAAQSDFDQAVGENPPGQTADERKDLLARRQAAVNAADHEAAVATSLKDKATSHRKEMERVRGIVTAEEDAATAALNKQQIGVKLLTAMPKNIR